MATATAELDPGLDIRPHTKSNACLAFVLLVGEFSQGWPAGKLWTRMQAVATLASLILTEDGRGDPVAFNSTDVQLPYEEVLAAYLGDTKARNQRSRMIADIINEVGAAEEGSGYIWEVCDDWTIGDAGMTTLILHGGDERVLPPEVRTRLRRLGILNKRRVVGVLGDEDGVLDYRYWQSHLCSRALLSVYFAGNKTLVETALPWVRASMLTLQVATDLYHHKNLREPTYRTWWARQIAETSGDDLPRARLLFEEAGVNFAPLGKIRGRMLGAGAALAVLGLCRLMGQTVEWGK